jgi:hypothetical protein
MLLWLKRLFLGDDRLFLSGSHMNGVFRAEHFHAVKCESEARRLTLFLDYERHGKQNLYFDTGCIKWN